MPEDRILYDWTDKSILMSSVNSASKSIMRNQTCFYLLIIAKYFLILRSNPQETYFTKMIIETKQVKFQALKLQDLNSWPSIKQYIMDYFGTKDSYSGLQMVYITYNIRIYRNESVISYANQVKEIYHKLRNIALKKHPNGTEKTELLKSQTLDSFIRR